MPACHHDDTSVAQSPQTSSDLEQARERVGVWALLGDRARRRVGLFPGNPNSTSSSRRRRRRGRPGGEASGEHTRHLLPSGSEPRSVCATTSLAHRKPVWRRRGSGSTHDSHLPVADRVKARSSLLVRAVVKAARAEDRLAHELHEERLHGRRRGDRGPLVRARDVEFVAAHTRYADEEAGI